MTGSDETQRLWLDYRRTGDEGFRNHLLVTYAPLVRYVASRLSSGLPDGVNEEDVVSYGLQGLIEAIELYDPTRDVKFDTYAMNRVKRQIVDELCATNWGTN